MRSRGPKAAMAALIVLLLYDVSTTACAADRHAGYYYPAPQTSEEYKARSKALPDADRHKRVDFINGLTGHMLASPYPPQFAVFAKGAEAEKVIIVSLSEGRYNTPFRARALFAILTALSRRTPFFQRLEVDDVFTFFDLLFLLGFKQLTVSDGDTFAHQVTFN